MFDNLLHYPQIQNNDKYAVACRSIGYATNRGNHTAVDSWQTVGMADYLDFSTSYNNFNVGMGNGNNNGRTFDSGFYVFEWTEDLQLHQAQIEFTNNGYTVVFGRNHIIYGERETQRRFCVLRIDTVSNVNIRLRIVGDGFSGDAPTNPMFYKVGEIGFDNRDFDTFYRNSYQKEDWKDPFYVIGSFDEFFNSTQRVNQPAINSVYSGNPDNVKLYRGQERRNDINRGMYHTIAQTTHHLNDLVDPSSINFGVAMNSGFGFSPVDGRAATTFPAWMTNRHIINSCIIRRIGHTNGFTGDTPNRNAFHFGDFGIDHPLQGGYPPFAAYDIQIPDDKIVRTSLNRTEVTFTPDDWTIHGASDDAGVFRRFRTMGAIGEPFGLTNPRGGHIGYLTLVNSDSTDIHLNDGFISVSHAGNFCGYITRRNSAIPIVQGEAGVLNEGLKLRALGAELRNATFELVYFN
ncbi:hypothetical protein NVP1121O_031 [Vibrio phage 1.121.O._10N.286.46.C4]|nr:hypothetical protein NVP1121O_031 [Vibrio phage 1.121.O._10N.286.46.C4]